MTITYPCPQCGEEVPTAAKWVSDQQAECPECRSGLYLDEDAEVRDDPPRWHNLTKWHPITTAHRPAKHWDVPSVPELDFCSKCRDHTLFELVGGRWLSECCTASPISPDVD